MDGVFDELLEGLITVIEDFDVEGLVLWLEYLHLCLDVWGVHGVNGVFDSILEGLVTLTEVLLHWKLIHCNGFSPYINCCLHDCFFVSSNKTYHQVTSHVSNTSTFTFPKRIWYLFTKETLYIALHAE